MTPMVSTASGVVIYLSRILHLYLRCVFLLGLLGCFLDIRGQTTLAQHDVRSPGNTTWSLSRSPFRIQQTLVIPKGSLLIIEPGVRLEFLPGCGLIVQGALLAMGESQRRIVMTSSLAPIIPSDLTALTGFNDPILNFQRDIRLVRGLHPGHGQIQLHHKGKWRSVCTHSYNWTAEDIRVACVQMGFLDGLFDAWVEHVNDTDYMAISRPKCSGLETTLTQCVDYGSAQISHNICEGHPDMLIRCLRQSSAIQRRHWMGIKFMNATYTTQFPFGRTVQVNVTFSRLQHVDILYAGSGQDGEITSGIEALGAPPVIVNCSVKFSASNGLNFTHTTGAVQIVQSTFEWNKGNGISINSTTGNISIHKCLIENNFDDGINFLKNDTIMELQSPGFCTRPQIGLSQTYPLIVSGNQDLHSSSAEDCVQKFYVEEPYILTVHFLMLEATDANGGYLEIRDGSDYFSRHLVTIPITNDTRPESISTNGNRVWIRFRGQPRQHIRFVLRITAGLDKEFDLNVTESLIANNHGRGIAIRNMRSGLHVGNSIVRENRYRAGIHVEGGSGDVNITHSVIQKNHGDGINITYVGGRRNITSTKLSENRKRGIAISFNETIPYKSYNQETHILHSFIEQNWMQGILHGNFCSLDSLFNVTNTSFMGNQDLGIELWSCLTPNSTRGITTFVMEWNTFTNSSFVALKIRPAALLVVHIGNNTFSGHKRGVIWIQNMDYPFHDEFAHLPADINIGENTFLGNQGPFVVLLGLTESSPLQNMRFMYNYLRDNAIIPATGHVRRHRSEGVIVTGSSNVYVNFNSLDNPNSPIWLATHSRNPGKSINATSNWWGTTAEQIIYDHIFGGKDRYDLSHIVFRPYLSRPDLVDPESIAPPPEYRKPVVRGNLLGGLYGDRSGSLSGEYHVESDLIIQPNSILTIRAGTKLLFDAGIGMLSQGKIVIEGTAQSPVIFDMKSSAKFIGFSNDSLIRLVNGPSPYEGRLELFIDGQWGSVCNERWSVKNAGVVCRQLGLAHAPEDFSGGMLHYGPGSGSVLFSNVRCDDWDWDIQRCPHDGEFEHICSHLQDVGVKCRQPGWAGLRLPITAEQSIIDHVIFRRAGILDFDTQAVSSALQIDFNIRHRVKNCLFEENANAGLLVLYNHLQPGNNLIQGARFRLNGGSGLVTHCPGLTVVDSEFIQNGRAGLLYNPKITRYQQREFVAFLERRSNWRTHSITAMESKMSIQVEANQEVLVVSTSKPHSTNGSVIIDVVLKDMAYVLGVQILNPPSRSTTEFMKIFNGDRKAADVEVWLVDERVNHLPATSVSYKLVLEYQSGTNPTGGIMILFTPLLRRDNNPLKQFTISVENCLFDKNKRAVETMHYDLLDQHENNFEFPHRYYNESIRVLNSRILNSVDEGLRVVNYQPWINVNRSYECAEFYMLKSLTQISYIINGSTFANNGAGISLVRDGFLNVEASGNIYQWTVSKNGMTGSTGPVMTFDFPISFGKRNYAMWNKQYMRAEILRLEYEQSETKFWEYILDRTMYDAYDPRWMEREHLRRLGYQSFHASTDNLPLSAVHSLQISENKLSENRNTYIAVNGDFLRMNFTRNEVSKNSCPPYFGLFRISGTEKEFNINSNLFLENSCKFVMEFDISSHTASTGRVPANFKNNDVRRNRGNTPVVGPVPDTNPDTYAVAVKGLQRVNVTSNLIENPGMKYEFISGLLTDRLRMELAVQFNWWGSQNVTIIQQKIFDFDDWNCYALAQFVPFLSAADLKATLSTSDSTSIATLELASGVLGGRLEKSVTLPKRSQPYIVNRDLTILPGVSVTIESGARIEFFPNVGILVLGHLKAVGRLEEPIVFAPVTRSTAQRAWFPIPMSQIKPVSDIGSVRLFGGRTAGEGYLEVFNITTNQWVPIWHHDFSTREAQVVCTHLGQPTNDVQVWRGPRIEDFRFVRTWMRPFYCLGNEVRIHDCELPLLEVLIPSRSAMENLFVYVRCEGRHMGPEKEYWGGIRFARAGIEDDNNIVDESILENVQIIGAGMLHGKQATGALEILNRNPLIERVRILSSASNGIMVINPSGNLIIHHVDVEQSVLVGINILLLHGDLQTDSSQSSFDPIRLRLDSGMASLPPMTAQFINGIYLGANIFGMVDICSADKVLYVQKRLLILFRYGWSSLRRDCVKIFQISGTRKMNRMPDQSTPKIGFRVLEWNLHRSEYLPNGDFIELFEGNVYNNTDYRFLARLNATNNIRQTFESSKETITIHLSTTVAPNPATYGFIAEVVTLPPAYIGISREAKLNVTSSKITANRRGGLQIYTTGEFNPIIAVERCLLRNNGEKVFHNFSTSYRAAYLDVQNTPQVEIHNNNFRENHGGLHIVANSMTAATRMQANIRSNLFYANRIGSALAIFGRSISPYQEALISRNILFDNTGQFTDNIVLGNIVGNFSYNQVFFNLGRYNMLLDGFKHVRLSDYQTVQWNSFIRNVAYGRPGLNTYDFKAKDRTTIFATESGQSLTDNVLSNPDNDLDLHVTNQTELFPLHAGVIKAVRNYWGSPYDFGVSGRIKDKNDNRWLHEVIFTPFHATNASLMDGKCYPGFKLIQDSCYLYIGGVATYNDANLFCKSMNASLPYVDKLEYQLTRFVHEQQRNFDWRADGVWVHSYASPMEKCIALRNQRLWYNDNCDAPRPFICERDTAFVVVSKAWHTQMTYLAVVLVAVLALVLVAVLTCCWLRKSKLRQKETFIRRQSICESIRKSRSSLAYASMMSINGGITPSNSKLNQILPSKIDILNNDEDTASVGKSSRTFNSSAEYCPDYDFFEARNDAVILNLYPHGLKSHLTTSDLTYQNISFIDGSNSRTSTRTDTISDSTIDVKPDFLMSYPKNDEDSPRSFRYYGTNRQSLFLETDM